MLFKTPGLSKDMYMYEHTFLNLQSPDQTSSHTQAVSLVNAYGHFNLPQGFEWVCMVNVLTSSLLRVVKTKYTCVCKTII